MSSSKPYAVEYYYKVKWGCQQEFLALFRKNHWPILEKQIETGRILSLDVIAPRLHQPEESRWDYRVTIVFADAARAMEGDSADLIRKLYPNQEVFQQEEKRRFEILQAHWDLPIAPVDMSHPSI